MWLMRKRGMRKVGKCERCEKNGVMSKRKSVKGRVIKRGMRKMMIMRKRRHAYDGVMRKLGYHEEGGVIRKRRHEVGEVMRKLGSCKRGVVRKEVQQEVRSLEGEIGS